MAQEIQRRCDKERVDSRALRGNRRPYPIAAAAKDRRRHQIPGPRENRARMNLRRVRQHEIENAGQIGGSSHDQRRASHFLRRIARHRNSPLHSQRRQQQHSKQGSPGEPADRNVWLAALTSIPR